MELLDLPHCMIENILTYLTYDEIAVNRRVCTLFNEIGSRLLNRGFATTERRHAAFLKKIKAQLPRRESERRYHPLGRQCEILWCIETRISILNTCYNHFSERGLCCFIPGKILDEVNKLISSLQTMDISTLPQANTLLQELRDLCSMAVEHFRDKISPTLTIKLKECLKHGGGGYVDMDDVVNFHVGLNDFSTFINNSIVNECERLPNKGPIDIDDDFLKWINGFMPHPDDDDTERQIPPVARTLARISFKVDHNHKATRGLALKYQRLRKQVNGYRTLAASQKKQMRALRNIVYKIQERLDAYESKYGEMSKLECNRILSEPRRHTITKRRNSQIDRSLERIEASPPAPPAKCPRLQPVTITGTDVPVMSYIKHIMRQSTDSTPPPSTSKSAGGEPITKPRNAAVRLPFSITEPIASTPPGVKSGGEMAPQPVRVRDTNVSAVGYVRHMLRHVPAATHATRPSYHNSTSKYSNETLLQ